MLKKSSVYVAKSRLKTLVTSDRTGIKSDDYDHICKEFSKLALKYFDVPNDKLYVEINRNTILISFTGESF